MKKLMLLALLMIMPMVVQAAPIKVNMLGVVSKQEVTGQPGPLSLSVTLQKKLHRVGTKRIASKGINIDVGWFKPINDPFPNYRFGSDLGVIFNEFSASYFYAIKAKLIKSRETLHYLAPPLVVDGIKYMGGVGSQCSAPKGGFSYSNAMEFNSRGAARTIHSIHSFMHELLHALGADHIDSPISIMHPDTLNEIDKQINAGGPRRLNILDVTRSQIFKCIGK